ncbi:MAG: glycosyltransferase [Cyanobacteria bacterium P01_G01_bin.39]
MKIFFLVLGTRGDVEIFLKLARELQQRGHNIIFGTSLFYRERVQAANLKWFPIGDGQHSDLLTLLQSLAKVEDKLRRSQIYGKRWLKSELAKAKKQISYVGVGADYFISNLHVGLTRFGQIIPGAAICYDPPESLEILQDFEQYHGQVINIVAMNRELLDPQHLWKKTFHFTGFWLDPPIENWNPPPDLQAFLAAGSPPIVLTMGSMVMFDAQRLIQIFIKALERSQQRGIIIGGWSNLSTPILSEKVYYAAEIPYSWLFPQAACVVHHGGVGTIAEVLRAGTSSMILPQVLCQSDFAKILMRENLANGSFEVGTLHSEDLAKAIDSAISEPQVRHSTRHWQSIIQGESGLHTAADLVEEHWQKLQNCQS